MQSGQIQTKSSVEEKDQSPLIKLHYGIIKKSLDDLNNNRTYYCIKNAFEKLGEKSASSLLAKLIKEHSADHSEMHEKCPACLKSVSLINSSFFYGHQDENVRKAIIDSLKMLESLPKNHLSLHFNHFICDFYPFVTEERVMWTPNKIKIKVYEYYFNFFDELDFANRIFFEVFVNIIYGFMYTDDKDEVEKYLKKYCEKNSDLEVLNDLCSIIDTRLLGLLNYEKSVKMADLFEKAIVKNIIHRIEKAEGALHDPLLIVQKIQTLLLEGQFHESPISFIEIYLTNYILNRSFEKYLDKQSLNNFIFKSEVPFQALNRILLAISSNLAGGSSPDEEMDKILKMHYLYKIVSLDKRFNKKIEKSFNECFVTLIWKESYVRVFGKSNTITKAAEKITARLLKEKKEKDKNLVEINPKNPSQKNSDESKNNIKKIDLNKSKPERKTIEKNPFFELELNIKKIKSYASASEIKEKNIEQDIQEIKELADLSKANEKFHCLIAALHEKMDILHQSILSLKMEKNKISHLENDPKSQPLIEEVDEAIKKYEDRKDHLAQLINKIKKEKSIVSDKLLMQIESNKSSLSQLGVLHKKIASLDKAFDKSPSNQKEKIAKEIGEAIRIFNKGIENFNGDQLTDKQTQALDRYQAFVSACAKKYNKEPKETKTLKKEARQNSIKKHVVSDEKATEPTFQKPLNDEKTSTTATLNLTFSKQSTKPDMKVVPSYMKELKREPTSTFSQENYFRQYAFHAFNALQRKEKNERIKISQKLIYRLEKHCKKYSFFIKEGMKSLVEVPGFIHPNKAQTEEKEVGISDIQMLEHHLTTLSRTYKNTGLRLKDQSRYYASIGSAKSIDSLNECLQSMHDRELFPDMKAFDLLIEKLIELGFLEEAYELFDIAKKHDQLDVSSYEKMFNVAYAEGWTDVAQSLHSFLSKSSREHESYTKMMHLYQKNHSYIDAKAIFETALLTTCPKTPLVIKMMQIAMHTKHLDEAIDIYEQFKNSSELKSSLPFHQVGITAYLFNKDEKKAAEIDQKYNLAPQVIEKSGHKILDLHGCSYGSAFLAVKRLMSQSEEKSIKIIYGQGHHSKHKNTKGHHPVKQAVLDVFNEHRNQWNIKENQFNPGEMSVQRVVVSSHGLFNQNSHGSAGSSSQLFRLPSLLS